jgi:hypothetical protein
MSIISAPLGAARPHPARRVRCDRCSNIEVRLPTTHRSIGHIDHTGVMGEQARIHLRRWLFVGLIVLQLGFVVRAYWAPHKEFGYQMFPEASSWQADIVRVTGDGDRIPIDEPWAGYMWNELVRGRGLSSPWRRQRADAGLDNQLEFLDEALAWVAANTPDDHETQYLEAEVTTWHNMREPTALTLRSPERDEP